MNQHKSHLESGVSAIFWVLLLDLSNSMQLRKTHAGFTYLCMYSSSPRIDCIWGFVQTFLPNQSQTIFVNLLSLILPVPELSLLGLKRIRGFVSILRSINSTIIIIFMSADLSVS